tara:strand:+ start:18 stop:587 length:570 start_codon:yes stop_codon:yes gene_type:complete
MNEILPILRDVMQLQRHEEKLRALAPALFAKEGDMFKITLSNPHIEHRDDMLNEVFPVIFLGKEDGYYSFEMHPRYQAWRGPLRFWHEECEVRSVFGDDNISLDELPYSGRCGELGANSNDESLTEAMLERARESQKTMPKRYRIGAGGDCFHYRVFMKRFKVREAALPLFRCAGEEKVSDTDDSESDE